MDLAAVRARVDRAVARYLEAKRARLGPGLDPVLDAVEALTLRGGKRLRPLLVFAGYAAVAEPGSPAGGEDPLADAAAAFELLQTYLLIQDDWMDQDDTRRGGPSAHAKLRTMIAPPHRADSVALLASDLACTDAWSLLAGARFPLDRVQAALAAFATMSEEVVLGQYLDVIGSQDVARVHLWKTAGYTVRWPLAIGAILGGADAPVRAALDGWARPLGLAFQMQDDVLGTFGDPAVTGKPAGNDLRQGKETVVLAAARARPEVWRAIEGAVGSADVGAAIFALEEAGIRREIEARIAAHVAEASRAIEGVALRDEGRRALSELAVLLTARAA